MKRAGARGAAIAALALTLSACGTPTACLANRYDVPPRTQCISGVQLPYGLLKDNDPMSGSAAPIKVAQ